MYVCIFVLPGYLLPHSTGISLGESIPPHHHVKKLGYCLQMTCA